jgi:hypothetical protein
MVHYVASAMNIVLRSDVVAMSLANFPAFFLDASSDFSTFCHLHDPL